MIKIIGRHHSGYSIVFPLLANMVPSRYSDADRVEVFSKPFLTLNVIAILLLIIFRNNEVIIDDVGFSLALYAFVRRHVIKKRVPESFIMATVIAPLSVSVDYATFAAAFAIFFALVSFFVSKFLVVFGIALSVIFMLVALLPILNILKFQASERLENRLRE